MDIRMPVMDGKTATQKIRAMEKGAAGMFGFQKLAALVTHLSQSIKANNSIVVKELFTVLDTNLSQLQKQFKS